MLLRPWPSKVVQTIASSSLLRTPVCVPRRSAPPLRAFAPALAFVLTIAAEYRRAVEAAQRYEQLKRMVRRRDEPKTDTARRIYMEFYSDT
jgi:hypothetical protein